MPMYDYRCERCSAQFEVRQSFSDDTLAVCPPEGGPAACDAPGEGPLKKVFSGVAISFKGDGFYKNDHGANAKGRRKEQDPDSSKDSSGKDSSGKDSSGKDSSGKDSSGKDSSGKDSSGKGSSSSSSGSDGGRATADAGTSSSSS